MERNTIELPRTSYLQVNGRAVFINTYLISVTEKEGVTTYTYENELVYENGEPVGLLKLFPEVSNESKSGILNF